VRTLDARRIMRMREREIVKEEKCLVARACLIEIHVMN
jgi:hypothetical protein